MKKFIKHLWDLWKLRERVVDFKVGDKVFFSGLEKPKYESDWQEVTIKHMDLLNGVATIELADSGGVISVNAGYIEREKVFI